MPKYPPPPEAVAEILADWAGDQLTQGLRPRSVEERAQAVIRYVRFSKETDPLAFTTRMLKRWIGRENLSTASKWTYGQHMQAYHAWLVRTRQREDNPMADIVIPKKPHNDPRPVADHQLAAILRAADRSPGPVRLMVLLAVLTGLRVHEIAKIHDREFDPIEGTLVVTGKGDKTFTLYLHGDVLAAIEAHRTALAEDKRGGYWFANREDEPITRHHVSALIRGAMREAGVDATPHALRHTFATSLVNADVDLLTIQKLMRHSSATSTQIYADVSSTRRAEAIRRLELPAGA